MNRWLRKFPRPSLMWMSIDDVMRVRNAIIGLYLGHGDLRLVPPHGRPTTALKLMMNNTTPKFEWLDERGNREQVWFRYDDNRVPYWDYESYEMGVGPNTEYVQQIPFNDPRARVPATIVKHLSRYFPFVSTDNYLVNGGKPIA